MNDSTVLVTGGGGYVGAALVPEMLERKYRVKVLDLFLYGADVLDPLKDHPRLEIIRGDIRDEGILARTLAGCDKVIHLACISNDPSFELNPALGKSINLDAFEPLVRLSKESGVRRFIYASSSSVYGLKKEENVDETLSLQPLTDYSRFKAVCEKILRLHRSRDFCTCSVRPATVCGYSPRQRLDVIVNILTNHAVHNGEIKIFGGDQQRPSIHIRDMVDAYLCLLEAPEKKVAGEVFNVGYENHTVRELAQIVSRVVGEDKVKTRTVPTEDNRSYHISSEKIARVLDFKPSYTIEDAVRGLTEAFREGKLPGAMEDSRYFNIKRMQEIKLN